MTKEELEKEAEEYRKEKLKERKDKFVFELPEVYVADIKQTYIAGAEPREKRIAELEAQVNRQIKNVLRLEAQTEKMKSDVKANIKWADENKNNQMYCKLNAMINQWEIKEK